MSKEVIKAEELAKKQREISVSEFFAKNRHLLGFDNPTRALLMTVKELVDNSLTYNMPILVKKGGTISISKIGELIDEQIETNKESVEIMRGGHLEKLRIDGNIEVLAFDRNTLKIAFHNVSTLFRHKVNSKIYRVKLTSGRYVDLTAYHSVFTLDKGKVVSIPTSELKVNMPILVPRHSWENPNSLKEINLIEELLALDPNLTSKINLYGITSLFTDRIIKEIKSILPRPKWYRISDFKRLNYLPFNIIRQLHLDINLLSHSKIGMSICRYKIPAILKVDHNLAELLGLYMAEGSILKSLQRIHFSFGSHEKDLIYYLIDLFEKVFRFSPKIRRAHATAYNVVANSTIIGFIFKHVLKVGDSARTKRIPDVVFNFNKSQKYSFLLAYLSGDGYPSNELFHILKNNLMLQDLNCQKVTSVTASFDLHVGLQYLLSSLGINYSIGYKGGHKRLIGNALAKFGEAHFLFIYTNNKKSPADLLPLEHAMVSTSNPQLKYSITNDANRLNISFEALKRGVASNSILVYNDIQNFLDGDLGVLRIKSIEEIEYNREWVYDVSVPGCENFIAGVGAIVCHNSIDATDELRIPGDIKVELKQISENRFIIIVEDNGPGIVKEQIPKVFGKLLYGSKFHRFRMSRGQQGLGVSVSVLYSQLTTGKATKVISRISPKKPAHYYEIQINTQKNEPEILREKDVEWKSERGTKVEIELEGRYQKGKQSVDEYVKQTAIANPHVSITYKTPEGETVKYARAVNELPIEPKEIKPHPYGIEIGNLITMLQYTKARTLQSFLTSEFSRIGSGTAKEMCSKASLNPDEKPSKLTNDQIEKLFKAMRDTKVIAPPTDCLSPITSEVLEKALKKEYEAEFYVTTTRSPVVYRGFPFQIETAIIYSSKWLQDEQVRLIRLANRVPLLYQQGACAITEAVTDTNWKAYGLQQSGSNLPSGPAVILVHIASVWVPFTSEAKEAVAHYEDITKEIKLALQECGRKLSIYIHKNIRAKEQRERASLFDAYIPELASALNKLCGEPKSKIEEGLKKRLKKDLPLLMAGEQNAKK
ncbi:DNA topoisomerase VI subunit B [Candidatus Woesearchaeota archaeon]|nr:DNA topoisomerase VI subunit B [Candidatus Woesearchaeota archaeon]